MPQWEVTPDDKAISGLTYDECSFTTYATHDHPPMAAIWDGCRHNMHHAPEHEDRMKAGRELRDRIEAGADAAEEELLALARASEKVSAHLADKQVVKEIVVPGKLVNLVVR